MMLCPICFEYEPHYCAAIVKVTIVRLRVTQGQRPKWAKKVEITDRMPPYETVRSTRLIYSLRGDDVWNREEPTALL